MRQVSRAVTLLAVVSLLLGFGANRASAEIRFCYHTIVWCRTPPDYMFLTDAEETVYWSGDSPTAPTFEEMKATFPDPVGTNGPGVPNAYTVMAVTTDTSTGNSYAEFHSAGSLDNH